MILFIQWYIYMYIILHTYYILYENVFHSLGVEQNAAKDVSGAQKDEENCERSRALS